MVIACQYLENGSLPNVAIDNIAAAKDAVAHLISLGHKRIGCLAGPASNVLYRDRLTGYLRALTDHAIPVNMEYVSYGDSTFQSGYEMARELLQAHPEITAVFASGDVMAIGEEAKSDDLALFAWGGQNAADYYHELALSMAIKEGGLEVAKVLDRLEEGAYEQPTVVDAFAAIEDAVKEGYFLSGGAGIKHTEAQTEWVMGKAVMYPSGSWIENEQRSTTPDDYDMTGAPTPMLSDGAAMGPAAIHGAAGEPFMVPSKAANGAGGLELLRVMLSKEQCENFSKLTSSMTIVKDTIPEDGFGSTALSSVSSMISEAGEDVFTFNFTDWYGMGDTFKPLWAEFLNGDITAEEARERSQSAIDTIREDDSAEKFDVE